jgi:hypothetical protein
VEPLLWFAKDIFVFCKVHFVLSFCNEKMKFRKKKKNKKNTTIYYVGLHGQRLDYCPCRGRR